jgi:hypothetical protein
MLRAMDLDPNEGNNLDHDQELEHAPLVLGMLLGILLPVDLEMK